jgi:CsoR family transcriptional regulator, copper-sensing transcriptional repressor
MEACGSCRNPHPARTGYLPYGEGVNCEYGYRDHTGARLQRDQGQLGKRLRRIEGQVRGIEKMVDEDRYRIDVLTQISAVQAALDKVALGLLDDHARHCIIERRGDGEPAELTDELMAAVGRLMRRG